MVNSDDMIEWQSCQWEDLWIFDKLLLSRWLNYKCGPAGVTVPEPDNYIVRPITNLLGMGRGATVEFLQNTTDHLPLGHFWCELFSGRHLSVDYYEGKQTLCVEGIRNNDDPLYKWKEWKQVNDKVPLPNNLQMFTERHKYINCEFIGGNLVEMHFRTNPDPLDVQVVWEDEDTTPPTGMIFISDPDYKRLGFFKKI